MSAFRKGDWVTFDLMVGQLKEIRDETSVDFSDGTIETCGNLLDRCRPLSLRTKYITECFKTMYDSLREIDGEGGFNYPRIHDHFAYLCNGAIDADGDGGREFSDRAVEFVEAARKYHPVIQGVSLFRQARRR